MPLIKDGKEAENSWVFLEQNADAVLSADLKDGQGVSVTLDVLVNNFETLRKQNRPIGVRLAPDDDAEKLKPFLDSIGLIEVDFPKYTDGRGYSHAQLLRRRYGYQGELRAVGHVLRDQIFYMNRSGFDAYETDRAGLSSVLEALSEYSEVYQPAASGRESVFRKRHS